MGIKWDENLEKRLLHLKDVEKKSYKEIALEFNTTVSSLKHKYVRLNQSSNDDRHHHPVEKIEQIKRVLPDTKLSTLEMNAGWGNLTQVYLEYGEVVAQDIDKEKVSHLNALGYDDLTTKKCDSFKEIYSHVYKGKKYDVIDLDPYGFPSRYFPHVFNLIDDGIMFVTFPKMGVQQINKITKEHYRVFWNITLEDKERQLELINYKIKDYAFHSFRSVDLIDTVDLGRMFRLAYKVKKESALDLVGLKVKGINC